jgi:hypothetical protein
MGQEETNRGPAVIEDKEVGESWQELREGEANHKIYAVIGINLIRKLVEERAIRLFLNSGDVYDSDWEALPEEETEEYDNKEKWRQFAREELGIPEEQW